MTDKHNINTFGGKWAIFCFSGRRRWRRAGKSFCGSVLNHAEHIMRTHALIRIKLLAWCDAASIRGCWCLAEYPRWRLGPAGCEPTALLDVWQNFEKISTTPIIKKNLKEQVATGVMLTKTSRDNQAGGGSRGCLVHQRSLTHTHTHTEGLMFVDCRWKLKAFMLRYGCANHYSTTPAELAFLRKIARRFTLK